VEKRRTLLFVNFYGTLTGIVFCLGLSVEARSSFDQIRKSSNLQTDKQVTLIPEAIDKSSSLSRKNSKEVGVHSEKSQKGPLSSQAGACSDLKIATLAACDDKAGEFANGSH
jgi:hypothetical protein